MSRRARIIGGLLLGTLITVLVVVWVGYRATQVAPAFYREALHDLRSGRRSALSTPGDQMERGVLELHGATQLVGEWEQVFSESHVNDWLATDLLEKFPDLLPAGVSEPLVQFTHGRATVACRLVQPGFTSVISLGVRAQMLEEPNLIAIQILDVRAGLVPLPRKRILDLITRAAADANVPLRWSSVAGVPTAIIPLTLSHGQSEPAEVVLETIEISDGQIRLAGRTESIAVSATARRGDSGQAGEKMTVQ